MDLVVKERDMTEKAKEGLLKLRQSDIDLTDLFNEFLEKYSKKSKTSQNIIYITKYTK